ncbi:HTH-type transcriptional repressor SmtB [Corynebacterium faecale]|uniref:ArsR/SmtB family transcription factor n=1 Tax=Corynebacterium faecale TaxID=1758466 RepID=UPI0025B45527|nr:metalloregulator ArsR/SmtB family transcription factor [Corynebacterium faecale]WJY92801.1 HTH-type transcriptional repressor SmtB [Corynebacterium faecale]
MVKDSTRSFIAPLEDEVDQSISSYPATRTTTDSTDLGSPENVAAISSLIRAVDSPLRIRMLIALNERPHYVSELVALVGSSQPLVSQHLKVLKGVNLVNADRMGRQMSYSLAQPMAIDLLKLALEAANKTSE